MSKHTPIIQQCLDRLTESLQFVDDEGYVKLRAESAVMIYAWLEELDLLNKKNETHSNS